MLDGISRAIDAQQLINDDIERLNEEDGKDRKIVDAAFVNPFRNFIIWVDDIKREQFENYIPRNEKRDSEYDDDYTICTDSFGGTYFKRREDQIFARNFGGSVAGENRQVQLNTTSGLVDLEVDGTKVVGGRVRGRPVIFTTTELLAGEMVRRTYNDCKVPELFGDTRMRAGRAYLFGSEIVGSKYDGILPMMVNELEAEYTLIGNGIGSDYNLSNTKGQNAFIGKNLIIKVSEPNGKVLRKYSDLEFADLDQNTVRLALVLDDLHQAVGRAGGNRYVEGSHMIVLVPPVLLEAIEDASRYMFSSVELLTGASAPVFDKTKQKDVEEFVAMTQSIDAIAFHSLFERKVKAFAKGIDSASRRKQFCSRLEFFYQNKVNDLEVGLKVLSKKKDKASSRMAKSANSRMLVGKKIVKLLKAI